MPEQQFEEEADIIVDMKVTVPTKLFTLTILDRRRANIHAVVRQFLRASEIQRF